MVSNTTLGPGWFQVNQELHFSGETAERGRKTSFLVEKNFPAAFCRFPSGMLLLFLEWERCLRVDREVPVPLYFDTTVVARYRIDLVVEGRLLVEVKACQALKREHIKQVLHYLKLTDIELALLLNFGASPEIKRFTLRNSLKRVNNNCNSLGKLQKEAGNLLPD